MKLTLLMTTLMTTAFALSVPAFATDEDSFGARFGQAAPSALGDDGASGSIADIKGFGMEDPAAAFNAIDPAAGEEDVSEEEAAAIDDGGDVVTDAVDGLDANAAAVEAADADAEISVDTTTDAAPAEDKAEPVAAETEQSSAGKTETAPQADGATE